MSSRWIGVDVLVEMTSRVLRGIPEAVRESGTIMSDEGDTVRKRLAEPQM